MKSCNGWSEVDDDVEYCRNKQSKCTCSGEEAQCNYPRYFRQTKAICKILRAREAMNRAVEPFSKKED